MRNYGLASLMILVVTLGLGWSLRWPPTPGGMGLPEAPQLWLLLGALGLLNGVGSERLLRAHPRWPGYPTAHPLKICLLSTLLVPVASLFIRSVVNDYWMVMGVAISGALAAAILLAEFGALDYRNRGYSVARFFITTMNYLLIFGTYYVVDTLRLPIWGAITVVMIVSSLMARELFRDESHGQRPEVYAAVVGLIMGEIRWGLEFWSMGAVQAGLFMLLIFYMVSGLVQHHLTLSLDKKTVMEFMVVAGVSLALLFSSPLWLG
ncbi:MAG: hypothetical protein HYU86_09515 [Chloroflexi bacterium]|nr:hypothetical protein [Chloroflexota bacterium]